MVTLGGGGGGSDINSSNSDSNNKNSAATRVIAACTLLVGHPNPSTPNDGDIDITLTASPLSGPRFDIMGRENGDITSGNYGTLNDGSSTTQLPANLANIITTNQQDNSGTNSTPSPTDTKEIESWIRRTIRSSRFINPNELGIEHGISAWRVRISLHVLNHEGNIADAALLCACAALADLRLPMVEIDRGVVRIVTNESSSTCDTTTSLSSSKKKVQRRMGKSLTLGPLPVPLTIAILPNNDTKGEDNKRTKKSILLVDPTHLEEDVSMGNTVTVVTNVNEEIVEFHKKGSESRLSANQVAAVASMAFGRARELEKLILGR